MDVETIGQSAPGYKLVEIPNRIRPPPSGHVPQLYPFQNDLVSAIRTEFQSHRRVVAVMPTGAGKTSVFCHIVKSAAEKNSRILVFVHRIEIVRQIVDRLALFGVRCGEIHPKQPHTSWPVQVGMIQTVVRRLERMERPHLIIVDESHHANAASYRKVFDHWSDVRVLGVTATPLRADGRGLIDVFSSMTVGPQMRWLIENGYLADYEYFAPSETVSLKGVRTTAGDYNSADLEVAVNTRTITGNAVEHYRRHLDGKPAIAFCVSLAHCRAVRDQFRESGLSADVIDGNMDDAERRALVRRLANGTLNVLVSCNVVNEGFDVPVVAGAILLRPTKSLAMFLQQVGRALRVKPDGSKAIILDHAGNIHRFGPPDLEREWSLEGKLKVEAASKHCKHCERVFGGKIKRDEIRAQCQAHEECPLLALRDKRSDDARELEVVEGALTEYRPPEWTNGMSFTGSDAKYPDLMRRSEGKWDRLEQIRKARGYKPAWTHFKRQEFDANGQWRSDIQ